MHYLNASEIRIIFILWFQIIRVGPHSRPSYNRVVESSRQPWCGPAWRDWNPTVGALSHITEEQRATFPTAVASVWPSQPTAISTLNTWIWMMVVPQKIPRNDTPTPCMPGFGFYFRISRVPTIKKKHFCLMIKPGSFIIQSVSKLWSSVIPLWLSGVGFRLNLGTLVLQ